LKAFLVARHSDAPDTHNIAELLDLVGAFSPAIAEALAGTACLTVYSIDIYSALEIPEVLPEQEQDFFKLVVETRDAILAEL
jgi:hypothetical protein